MDPKMTRMELNLMDTVDELDMNKMNSYLILKR